MLTLTLPRLRIQSLLRSIATLSATRRARRELAAMNDIALADVGLTRGAIEQTVKLPSIGAIDPARGARPPL